MKKPMPMPMSSPAMMSPYMAARSRAGKKSPVSEATQGHATAVSAPITARVTSRNENEFETPLIPSATTQLATTIISSTRRLNRSTSAPMGSVAAAPTNETTARSRPMSVLPRWKAPLSWPEIADTVPRSDDSTARIAASTAMICSRAGPPATLTTRSFAAWRMSVPLPIWHAWSP